MKISDLQCANAQTNNGLWKKMITDTSKRWNDKTISEAHYYAQLSLCYSCMFKPDECKMYAALVPDWADVQEKAEALVSVARMLVYEKKIKEALDYYTRVHALDLEHEVAIEEAGWCCFELKRWEQAEDWFAKGTILMEDYVTFWEGLGHSLAKQEKYEEALSAFKKAIHLCNKKRDGYYYHHMIGQCHANLNDFYRALGEHIKSIDANLTYCEGLIDIAALYFNHAGDINKAIEYLKKAEAFAEKDKNDGALQLVYMNLVNIYNKTMEFELYEHYQAKLMRKLGFGGLFGFTDDEEEF